MRPKWGRRRFAPPNIAKSAVRAFLRRKMDDWRWMKEIPESEMRRAVQGIKFLTKPRIHQMVCTLIGINEPRFLFSLDMGAGKTKISLDLIRHAKRKGKLRRALVCVPHLINVGSWAMQIEEHAPDLSYCELVGTREHRMELINGPDFDIYLINYDGLTVFMSELFKKKGKTFEGVSKRNAAAFAKLFNFLVLDECHNIGNDQNLWWAMCNILSKGADYCYGMTGTPHGKKPDRLWPQLKVIDRGETLGETIGLYHASLYTPHKHPYAYSGIEWKFQRRMALKLHRLIQHRSLRYDEKELGNLPPISRIILPATMTTAQLTRYKQLTGELKAAEDHKEREQVFLRTRQVTSGFLGAKLEDGGRVEVAFEKPGKVLAVEQFLLQLDEEEKVVIFHEYTFSGKMLREMLARHKIQFTGVGKFFNKLDPRVELKRFMQDPKRRVWLAQNVAGSEGVDGLQKVARYCVFFESPVSPITRKQAEKRVYRGEQKRHTFIYDVVVPKTVDTRILTSIAQGRDLFEAVCNGRETL